MAAPLTSRSELKSIANDDILHAVDISDKSSSPEGTSKKIQAQYVSSLHNSSTGVLREFTFTVTSPTTFNIGALSNSIQVISINAEGANILKTIYDTPQINGEIPVGLGSTIRTLLYLKPGSPVTLVQSAGEILSEEVIQADNLVFIGVVIHQNLATIDGIIASGFFSAQQGNAVSSILNTLLAMDLREQKKITFYPYDATSLTLKFSGSPTELVDGELLVPGGTGENKYIEIVPAASPIPVLLLGWINNIGLPQYAPAIYPAGIDPTKYQNGSAALQTVPDGYVTVQRGYYFSSGQKIIVYGIKTYKSKREALQNYLFEDWSFIDENRFLQGKILVRHFILPKTATKLIGDSATAREEFLSDTTNTKGFIIDSDNPISINPIDNINGGVVTKPVVTKSGDGKITWGTSEIVSPLTKEVYITTAQTTPVQLTNNAFNYIYFNDVDGQRDYLQLTYGSYPLYPKIVICKISVNSNGIFRLHLEDSMTERVRSIYDGLSNLFPVRFISGMDVAPDPDVTLALDLKMNSGVMYYGAHEQEAPAAIYSRVSGMCRHFIAGGNWACTPTDNTAAVVTNTVRVTMKDNGVVTDAADVNTGFSISVTQQGTVSLPEIFEVACNAAGTLSAGDYFTWSTIYDDYYTYFIIDGVGTDPAIAGKIRVPVYVLSTDTADQVATKLKRFMFCQEVVPNKYNDGTNLVDMNANKYGVHLFHFSQRNGRSVLNYTVPNAEYDNEGAGLAAPMPPIPSGLEPARLTRLVLQGNATVLPAYPGLRWVNVRVGIDDVGGASASGNPFNQSLNTTDSVQFVGTALTGSLTSDGLVKFNQSTFPSSGITQTGLIGSTSNKVRFDVVSQTGSEPDGFAWYSRKDSGATSHEVMSLDYVAGLSISSKNFRAGDVHLAKDGTAGAQYNYVGADNWAYPQTSGTKSSFTFRFATNPGGASVADAAYFGAGTNTQWTTTLSTQDSYGFISVAIDGVMTDRLLATKNGIEVLGSDNSPVAALKVTASTQSLLLGGNEIDTAGGSGAIYMNGNNGNNIVLCSAGGYVAAGDIRGVSTLTQNVVFKTQAGNPILSILNDNDVVTEKYYTIHEQATVPTPASGYGSLHVDSATGDLVWTMNHAGTTKSIILADFSAM